MPNCFQLYRLNDPDKAAILLNLVDAEICQHFGVPQDPDDYWFMDWFGSIGRLLADGLNWNQIRERIATYQYRNPEVIPTLNRIIDFMETQYGSRSWVQIGK